MNNDHRKLRGTMKTKTERRKNRLLEGEGERERMIKRDMRAKEEHIFIV